MYILVKDNKVIKALVNKSDDISYLTDELMSLYEVPFCKREHTIIEPEIDFDSLGEGVMPSFEMPTTIEGDYIVPDLTDLTDLAIKERKGYEISNLTVITSVGNTFDADDNARANMNEAILASSITGITETEWKLADNSVVTVTVDELSEALALGIQTKGDIILA